MKYLISLASKYIGRQKFRTVLTFLSIMLAAFMMSISLFFINSVFASAKEFIIENDGRWEVDLTDAFMNETSDERYDKFTKLKDHVLVESASYSSLYEIYKECIFEKNISEEEKQIYDAKRFEVTFDGKYTVYADSVCQSSIEDDDRLFAKYTRVENSEKVMAKDGIILSRSLEKYGYKAGDRINIAITPVSIDSRGETCEKSFIIENFFNYEFCNNLVYSEQGKSREDYINAFYMYTFSGENFLENVFDKNLDHICENYSLITDFKALIRVNDGVEFEEAVDRILNDIGSSMKYIDLMQGSLNSFLLLVELKALVEPFVFMVAATFVFAFIFMIWLLTRLIIDNAFEISVTERNRKFTLLKTIGASKNQLKMLTFAEAVFYCITAVPAGMLPAYLIMKSLFVSFRNAGVYGMVFRVDPIVVVAGVLLCIISVVISSFTSAMWNTRKMTIVNALNYGNTIKIKKNTKKTKLYKTSGKFIRTYASRNIGRSKGKFVFSAFAGSISVMMLIVCTYIGAVSLDFVKEIEKTEGFSDFTIYMNGDIDEKLIDDLRKNELFAKAEISEVSEIEAPFYFLRLTVSNSGCYEEARNFVSEFANENIYDDMFDDNFMSNTGLREFLGANFKTALVFLIFTWLTSIVSMINLTNTRIMNSQREYFIFRCMGMSRKQLIYSVLHEVIVFSVVSELTGISLGIIFSLIGFGDILDSAGERIGSAIVPIFIVSVLSFALNILIPSLFASPLIKKLFSTSSEVVNSNEIR